jgi:transcriptional regulator GlxA family with amidase domain
VFLERRFEWRLGDAAGMVRDRRRGHCGDHFQQVIPAEPGREEAIDLLVVEMSALFDHRPGQARQRGELAVLRQAADDRFGALHGWINSHLGNDLSLSVLAGQAGMSERSFSRHYAEATGQTPARAIERLRVEAARALLSGSRTPVKRIAQRCGFGSEETMRRSFLRLLAVAPQDYRSRFTF